MFSNNPSKAQWFAAASSLAALLLLAAACASTEALDSEALDLESLGLAIDADIQAGQTLEVVVPELTDTLVRVASTPPGVTAAITVGPSPGTMQLSVNVEFDTPQGDYNIALSVVREDQEYELGWPFTVTEPGG